MALPLSRIIKYSIAIFLGLFFLWGFMSSLAKGKSTTEALKDLLPDLTFGQKKVLAEKIVLSEQQTKEIKELTETLVKMMAIEKKNCFIKYSGLSKFPEGVILEFNAFSGRTALTVSKVGSESGRTQIVSPLSADIPNMIPCVVGGPEKTDGNVYAKGFYNNYLLEGGNKKSVFNSRDKITIILDDGGYLGRTKNRINYYDSTDFHEFKGHQWLYKPDAKHICFFPTYDDGWDLIVDGCDGDSEDGLDGDCFTDEKDKRSLPYKVQQDLTLLCYGEFKSDEEPEPETSPTNLGEEIPDGGVLTP